MNNKKFNIIPWTVGVIIITGIAAAMLLVYHFVKDTGEKDELKNVVINVVDMDGNTLEYNVITDEQYLEGVMNDASGLTYETNDGMVMVVNGQRADYVLDGAYWSFYVNDQYCNYGISEQIANDGDVFGIVYTRA